MDRQRELEKHMDSIPTREPVPDALKVFIKADLIEAWHFDRLQEFRRNTRLAWLAPDSCRITLDDALGNLERAEAKFLCNQLTSVYWLQSAQSVDATKERNSVSLLIFEALSSEWLRCYKGNPNIEYGHFFANPVRITPTGPATVSGILRAHRSLCTQASSISLPQYHTLLPLYRAIVVIIDRQDWITKANCSTMKSDRLVSVRKLTERQTVLIARTGVEEGLSAPISFQSLKWKSLSLDRIDVNQKYVDVVRVPLTIAVQFIVGLQEREKRANPKMTDKPPLQRGLCPRNLFPKGFDGNQEMHYSAEAWANAHIAAAEKYGFDNDFETFRSIRRVQAGLLGENYVELEPWPWGGKWTW